MRSLALAALAVTAAACSAPPSNSGAEKAEWVVVQEELDSALISVWGTDEDDVWAVGGDRGEGPLVVHWDGESFSQLDSGVTGDLWWVHGFEDGPVFLGGEQGTIVRYEGGEFAVTTTPRSDVTVFGLWGSSPDEMWAVGGSDGGGGGAFAWRLDSERDAWVDAAEFPAELAEGQALWKVWGSVADDVWLVGSAGVAVHYDGESFETVNVGGGESLFTVHYAEGRFAAVGGGAAGMIFENAGGEWRRVETDPLYGLVGVRLAGADAGYAVGRFGAFVEQQAGQWREAEGPATLRTLHSIWVDPQGGLWTVGGELDVRPTVAGVLAYRGKRVPKGAVQ